MCVTSPPYWGLRDYGVEGQLGLEETPEQYVERLVNIFSEVKRVLRDDGTLWLNIGDSYASNGIYIGKYTENNPEHKDLHTNDKERYPQKRKGFRGGKNNIKPKDLIGIPWRVAFALQEDGWYLRNDIIWHKPNPMPESVKDRCTTSHEHIFLLAKSKKYYYDYEAILEPAAYDGRNDTKMKGSPKYEKGNFLASDNEQTVHSRGHERWPNRTKNGKRGKNKRDVWKVNTKPFPEAHFAVYPPDLIRPCIKAGCPDDGIVLDPFMGAGTTALVALQENKNFIGFELNKDYMNIAYKRIGKMDKKYYEKLPENEKPKQMQMF